MLAELVDRAVAMAKSVPEDPYCGLANPDQLATEHPDIEPCDPEEPAPDSLVERARAAEESARAVEGMTHSEGAAAGWARPAVPRAPATQPGRAPLGARGV